ncbi:glycosyltransferase involved in cell wall biosynthesis [Chitinophaga dinghuensis]|uniref:Glycosyltransferase involved in cell wall biosynthesis n=1 Tax=Chitinophaga dinghuensis TaxID=1539050 RepID=A0A327W1Q1_9BACT|nr:glycosyltransferase [Chitinophaga dinghuensis]RAJ82175.1 glycosyltransferase involved in cell wall biosynthesis [Chitinophaga dinghuensis]
MTQRKKILIIGTAYPFRGGLAAYNERLAEELQKEGHDVEIFTFTVQYPKFLFPGKSQYSTDPAPAHLRIKRLVNSVNPLNWLKAGRAIRKMNPDIILVKFWLPIMGPAFGSLLRLGKKKKHTKVISILDNVVPHEKRPGDVAFTKYFLKPVDAFIAMSQSVLNDLRVFEPNKPASLIPHPIYDNYGEHVSKEAARANLKLQPGKKYILFFGLIRAYKGLDLLLKAMADERMKQLDVHAIVAGEFYENAAPYQQLLEELQLGDRAIMHTEFIPNDEVKNYFCAADLVVQPYKSATQSGISQIAYHFDKPMVVTNVGGLTEMVPDGVVGFQCEPDPQSIATAIEKYFVDNREADMIAALQQEKLKYSWHRLATEIHKLADNIS